MRKILFIFLLFEMFFLSGRVFAANCTVTYICFHCCHNKETNQDYDCAKCAEYDSNYGTCGPGQHGCPNKAGYCCDNGTGDVVEEDPGYTAYVGCPDIYSTVTSAAKPLTTTQALQPILFRWDYNPACKWGKCSESDNENAHSDQDIFQKIPSASSGYVMQRIHARSEDVDGYIRTIYNWMAPQHYRYIKAHDNSDAFTYSLGHWSTLTPGKGDVLNWTIAQTNVRGATASATIQTFDGNGFILRYVARPYGGKMRVLIDGVEAVIIDQEVDREKVPWQLEWNSSSLFPDLSDGSHHVKLYHNNFYELAWIDALKIGDTIYDLGYGKSAPLSIPSMHPNVLWHYFYDNAYGGSQLYFRSYATASFDFTGKNFGIIYSRTSSSFPIDVTVDGVTKHFSQNASVGSSSETSLWRYNQEWQSPILSKGFHTITLEHVDDRFNKYINVDGIIVDDVKGGITTEGSYEWRVIVGGCSNAGSVCGPYPLDITLDTTATPSAEAWYQFVNGSGYAKSGKISVTVPETASDNDQRVLMGLSGGASTKSSGYLMSALTNGIDIPGYIGFTSRDWTVPDSNYFTPPAENFAYIKRLFELGTAPTESLEAGTTVSLTDWPTVLAKVDATDPTSLVYYHSGDVLIDQPLTINDGSKRTLFVKGNVTINADITVPVSNFLSIVASGNITIAGTVSKVQGLYVSDKVITIQDGEGSGASGLGDSRQFESQGSLIGWGGVQLQRTLSEEVNASYPAEKFIYRPDFIINAPSLYKRFGIQWREVAPGGVSQ